MIRIFVLTRYRLTPPSWPAGSQPTRIVVLADIHACEPWMSASRIRRIVEVTNRLEADLVVLLGDYVHGIWKGLRRIVPARDWGYALSGLEAPLGVYAVLGNHDWEVDGEGTRAALETNGIPVLENDAVLLGKGHATSFWIAGLGDQRAIHLGKGRYGGRDDLPGTLAQIPRSLTYRIE